MAADVDMNYGNWMQQSAARLGQRIRRRSRRDRRRAIGSAASRRNEHRLDHTANAAPTPNKPRAADHLVRLQATGATSADPSPARSPPRSAASRSAQSIGCTRKWSKSQLSSSAGSIPACGHTSFSSLPLRWTTSVPALGLTQIQSIPARRRQCPVRFDRDPEAARMQRVDQRRVELQHGLAAGDRPPAARPRPPPQRFDLVRQRFGRLANLPPPSPSVPTKSVSQKRHCAVARSCSRPLHRLQPAKRRNTARLPDCTPSPCSVRKHSLTA